MENENLLKKLRGLLGITQSELATLLEKSYSSIQGWEAGKRIPKDVIERMKAIAAQRGHADFAVALPGEPHFPVKTIPARRDDHRQPETAHDQRHDEYHQMLDEILNSNDPDAAPAVKSNLVTFVKYIRTKRPHPHRKKA